MYYCRRLAPWLGASALVILLVVSIVSAQSPSRTYLLQTFYGNIEIQEPVIIELLESDGMQRLKKIHQYGVARYVTPTESYFRYQHSIGVFALLRRYGVSLEEQIAGLLHDTSHTVFSHVGDHVFSHTDIHSSYQDDIHSWFLNNNSLSEILRKYGYTVADIHHKDRIFKALEQDLPNLCADRIEYNLQGGVLRGLIQPNEVEQILADLHFDGENWYFTSVESAKKLAIPSLVMTETLWGSAWSQMTYNWTAEAIRRATEIDLVSFNDIHFSTDSVIWHRLLTCDDELIKDRIHRALNYEKYFTLCAPEDRDLLIKAKFRGIDPLVATSQGLKPLTKIDPDYAHRFYRVKELMRQGWSVKLIDANHSKFQKKSPEQIEFRLSQA